MTTATTSPTNIWRWSTSSGKEAGRTTRCCATARAASSPIPPRCIACTPEGAQYRSTPSTSASRRRSARRCCTRPAPRPRPAFAAGHAECVFVNGSTPANVARRRRRSARPRAAPRPIQIFAGVTRRRPRPSRRRRTNWPTIGARQRARRDGARRRLARHRLRPFRARRAGARARQRGRHQVECRMRSPSTIGEGWQCRDLERHMILGARQKPVVGDPQAGRRRADAAGSSRPMSTASTCPRTVVPECLRISPRWSCRLARTRPVAGRQRRHLPKSRLFGGTDLLSRTAPGGGASRWYRRLTRPPGRRSPLARRCCFSAR